MTDHLQFATADTRARVHALGGDRFVAALARLVDAEEEFAVEWFDAKWDDVQADEVLDWNVVDVAAFGDSVAYVELGLELAAWPRPDTEDDDTSMSIMGMPGFARVLLGAPLMADRFDPEPEDLRSFIAAEADRGSVFDDDGTTHAEVAAYLASSRQRARPEDGASRPRVYITVEGDKLLISGLPGPKRAATDDHSPPEATKPTSDEAST